MNDQQPKRSYWTHGAKTRLHTYYLPADQWAGVALFGLIGIGGIVSATIGAWHWWKQGLHRPDGILLLVGAGALWLALVRGWRLIASAKSSEA